MPCITLSSGKTVCFEDNKYSNGGKTGPPDFNRAVSQRDSVANMAYNTMTWEKTAGSPLGKGLPDFGYHSSQEPVSKRPTNFTPPRNQQEAVDLFMKEVAPKVDYFPTAMEQAIAGDFMYNTGRDPRIYLLDQYLKSKGKKGLPDRGSYNVDTKSTDWTPTLQAKLDKEWNTYKNDINKLDTQARRVMMNNGRDFYYKNTYTDDEEGVTYWSRSKQKQNPDDAYDSKTGFYYQRGEDGSLSPQYGKTWYGRQHTTDQYEYVSPLTIKDKTSKYHPKKEEGGKNTNMKNGINNPGFKSLPGFVQQKIVANMAMGGLAIPTEGDKIVKNNAPAAPKQLTSQQLASLATSQFSKDPSMQTPLPNFIGSYQLTDMDKTLMMEAMKQMKGGQGSSGAYSAITPQMIDQIRPKVEQNRTMDQPMEREMGGMNTMSVPEMSITDPDYEQMMLQYGGMIQDLDGAQVIQKFGKGGGITYRGHKFPGYNKPIKTPPGDKYKKMVLVKKGDKVRLVKMGYNTKK